MTKISRREFLTKSALIGAAGAAGAMGAGGLLTSCGGGAKTKLVPLQSDIEPYYPVLGDKAEPGKAIRAGLIGCGNRGTGAALNFLEAADDVTIVAMGDLFADQMANSRAKLKEQKGVEIADDKAYVGADAYKKVCEDPDVDVVLIAPPGIFHAPMARYAVECGKHVFVEKPAGLDAPGCRTMLAAIRQAEGKGLALITGTQRHHKRDYIEAYRKVREGYIGEITSAVVKWNQGAHAYLVRRPRWTDMEFMIRDHFSWGWVCGDFMLEQLLHNVDVFQWFSHLKPVSVVGMGGRIRRLTGNVYDTFSADIVYEGNIRVSAQARQIDGCANDVSETIFGKLGWWTSKDMAIRDYDGNILWQYDYEAEKAQFQQNNPYVLEHVELINQIRSGRIVHRGETTVISSMTTSMGRESAHTGKEYTYEEYSASTVSLARFTSPDELKLTNIPNFKEELAAPIAGLAPDGSKGR